MRGSVHNSSQIPFPPSGADNNLGPIIHHKIFLLDFFPGRKLQHAATAALRIAPSADVGLSRIEKLSVSYPGAQLMP